VLVYSVEIREEIKKEVHPTSVMLHLRDNLTGENLQGEVWTDVESTLGVKVEERDRRKGNRP
jgi:hypothetical protein